MWLPWLCGRHMRGDGRGHGVAWLGCLTTGSRFRKRPPCWIACLGKPMGIDTVFLLNSNARPSSLLAAIAPRFLHVSISLRFLPLE